MPKARRTPGHRRNGTPAAVDNQVHEAEVRRVYATLKKLSRIRNEGFATGPFTRRGISSRSSETDVTLAVECGYPDDSELNAPYYMRAYRRWGIAARVVDLWPDESWAAYPRITENDDEESTEFEIALQELDKKVRLFANLHKADKLSGIGRFGILFLGYDDGWALDRAPPGVDPRTGAWYRNSDTGEAIKPRKPLGLNYVCPFDETLVTVDEVETDPRSPRYGRPVTYTIQFDASQLSGEVGASSAPAESDKTGGMQVHWTRVQHFADNTMTSLVWGTPRMEPVIDYLHDLRKVAGSSGEMFYKGGFPGYAFEQYPDVSGMSELTIESLREDMTAYQEGLQRFLASEGGKWNSLQPQVANPGPHVEVYGRLICTTIGVPTRTFFGSEQGHLASTQDDHTWRTRLKGRQTTYIEPIVLRPLLDRFIGLGILPKPGEDKYTVEWLDLRSLSDTDRADIGLKKVQTMMQYMTGDVQQVLPKQFLYTLVMGMTDDQATAIIKELEANPPPEPLAQQQAQADMEMAKMQLDAKVKTDQMKAKAGGGFGGGGRAGNPPARPKGRRPGSVEGEPKRAKSRA